jgi:hypothetical protein
MGLQNKVDLSSKAYTSLKSTFSFRAIEYNLGNLLFIG